MSGQPPSSSIKYKVYLQDLVVARMDVISRVPMQWVENVTEQALWPFLFPFRHRPLTCRDENKVSCLTVQYTSRTMQTLSDFGYFSIYSPSIN